MSDTLVAQELASKRNLNNPRSDRKFLAAKNATSACMREYVSSKHSLPVGDGGQASVGVPTFRARQTTMHVHSACMHTNFDVQPTDPRPKAETEHRVNEHG